jgi:hypothetical protein
MRAANTLVASARGAINFSRRPALLIARCFRYTAEEQSGERRDRVLRLVQLATPGPADRGARGGTKRKSRTADMASASTDRRQAETNACAG